MLDERDCAHLRLSVVWEAGLEVLVVVKGDVFETEAARVSEQI